MAYKSDKIPVISFLQKHFSSFWLTLTQDQWAERLQSGLFRPCARSGGFEGGLGVGQSWGGASSSAETRPSKALSIQDSSSPPPPGQCRPNLLSPPLLKCPYTVNGCWFPAMMVLDGVFCWIRCIGPRCGLQHLSSIKRDKTQTP